ncbi:MAG: hypothetical protein SVV80_12380 [Planctomycetota bacterium]|nr:hypothetical protein [Planctomycetota bacterium]
MTRKRKIVFIISAFVLVAAWVCYKKTQEPLGSPLTAQEASTLVERLVGAPIPEDATEIHGREVSFFTICINVRFSCSEVQFQTFLKASPRLLDKLDPNEKSLVQMQNNIPWWKPDSLTDTKGLETEWKDGTHIVSCHILAGKEPEGNQLVVYMIFVLEAETQRGRAQNAQSD